MIRALRSAALRLIPNDWRDAVARDLADEFPADTLAFACRAALVGIRLRTARALERNPLPSRTSSPRRLPMHDFSRDVRLAVRAAIRQPGHALAIVATLAIGIGANTAIFSVFNWILFRPLPGVSRPGELVTILYQNPKFEDGSYFVAYRDYADLRDRVTATISGMSASTPMKMDLATGSGTERIDAEVVTPNYLSVFGVSPMAGRSFLPEEEQPGQPATVLVSRRLAQRAYSSASAAIGATITLNGRSFTVVGVTPEAFQGRSMVTRTDVWLTPAAYATLLPDKGVNLISSRMETMFGDTIARLRPGASVAQAQAEATAAVDSIPEFASRSIGRRAGLAPRLYEGFGNERYAVERLTTIFRLLMGAVGLLLLLACANAANLLLARATARVREIAVRQAIGASRFRIVRQQLAEGLVLSGAAGLTGLALAVWLVSLFDGMRIIAFLPAVAGISVDWRVCAFALAMSLVTGVLFASAPALAGSRVDLLSSLKNGATASRQGRRLLRASLVTLQVCVAVVLLVTAGLFIRTLSNIRGIDLGIRPEGVVSFSIQPGRFGLDSKRSAAYIRELLEAVRSAPGVRSAAFTWTTSFSANRSDNGLARPERPDQFHDAAATTVSSGYFETMGIPLLAGRDFVASELREAGGASDVAILSSRLATELFPDGSAVGSRVLLSYPKGKLVQVVGIVGDVRSRAITTEPEGWMYRPAVDPTWGTIQVRSALPPAETFATIREAARRIDPVVAPHDIEAFGASVDRALSEQRLFARVSGIFAAVAAILAGIGIYGMMTGAVAERRKEFGIRLALGASSSAIVRMVIRSAATLSIAGLVIGIGSAAATRRFVESRLFGVTGLDPLTMLVVVGCVLLLSIAAALVPALRAAAVDPIGSLRAE